MKKENLHLLCTYLSNEMDWVSAETLASYLHTSSRSIHNYVREINLQYDSAAPIILSSKKGYLWNISFKNALDNLPLLYDLKRPQPTTPKERSHYIIRKLIYQRNIFISDIMEQFHISDRTVEEDILQIKKILHHFDLSIHKKRDYLYLTGTKLSILHLSAYIIMENCSIDLLSLEFLIQCFPEYDVAKINRLVNEFLSENNLTSNGYFRYILLLYIMLQIAIFDYHQPTVPFDIDVPHLHSYPEYDVANTLSDKLGCLIQRHYDAWNIDCLTALIISLCEFTTQPTPAAFPDHAKYAAISYTLMEDASRSTGADFTCNNFSVNISYYLQRMLIRTKLNLKIFNPLFWTFRNSQPILHDVAAWTILRLSKYTGVHYHANEISLLALRLGIRMRQLNYPFQSAVSCTLLCPAYYEIGEYLLAELTTRLGTSLDIKQVIDAPDIEMKILPDELIISVIPVKSFPHMVNIAPFPTDVDYRHIRQEIHRIKMEGYIQQICHVLSEHMGPDLFFSCPATVDTSKLLQRTLLKLEQLQCLTNSSSLIEELHQREAICSSSFFNTIALPHYCSDEIQKNTIVILTNHNGILYENQNLYMIVLILYPAHAIQKMYETYSLFIKLFTNPEHRNELLHTDSYEAFLSVLRSLTIK